MNKLWLIALLHVALCQLFLHAEPTARAGYSPQITHVLEQLRNERDLSTKLPLVEGDSENYGGSPGAFSLLAGFIYFRATPADVAAMLADDSAVVRLAAAKRILSPYAPSSLPKNPHAVDSLLKDSEKVRVGPIGDSGEYRTMTVGEVVAQMKQNPDFLIRTSNARPEPTR